MLAISSLINSICFLRARVTELNAGELKGEPEAELLGMNHRFFRSRKYFLLV